MTFDKDFRTDGEIGCWLWADRPDGKRVRFSIGHLILEEILGGGNPVHHNANLDLCERERTKIETACGRAFAARPGQRVELRRMDFLES